MSEPTRQGTPVLWALIASIIALVLIVGGFLGYNLMAEEDLGASEKTTEVTSSSASEKTTTEQATTEQTTTEETTTQPEPVYAEPVQPTYAEPTYAEPTYTQQYTSYDHNSHTSPAFAANVYGAWQQNYAATGQANTQLNVYSPTTGSNYNMTCYESGSAIRCVGGNNAVISIF